LDNCSSDEERKKTAELIRPILRGRDIKRYGYDWANLWLICTHNGVKGKFPRIDVKDYPAIKAHLDTFGSKVTKRSDQGDTPYNLRNCAYWEDFDKPKIVWAELSRTGNSFVFDCNQMFVGNTGYILTSNKGDVKTLNYLLGVLNSRIILYYLDLICTRFDDNGWRWLRQFVEVIPIPIILSDRCSDLITIVEKTDRQNQQEHSKAINKIVAEIYGLSKEEMDYINLYLYKY
jgi:hypothetical protein